MSTYPPEGTFSKDAETIARVMASKKVSPKGVGSGIRMIQYFINRGGKGLTGDAQGRVGKSQADPPREIRALQIACTNWQRINRLTAEFAEERREQAEFTLFRGCSGEPSIFLLCDPLPIPR